MKYFYRFIYKLNRKVLSYFCKVYSRYISMLLLKKGKSFYIRYPLQLHGAQYIEIGDNVDIYPRLRLEAFDSHLNCKFTPRIIIGNNVSINPDCHITAVNYVELQEGVLLASKVFITDHFHGEINSEALLLPPGLRPLYTKGPVVIEKNVWIGESVVVMPGVTIGENSIVGANSVVTRSVEKNSVIAGNPARLIRKI